MDQNVKLIYDLIQKDLRMQGWDDEAIAEAKAESIRERQAIGADDKTICIKEMSYLSQESLLNITLQMSKEKGKTHFFVRFKNWMINFVKKLWNLNWEAKIGVLLVMPAVIFMFNGSQFYRDIPTLPLSYGLMAIAGAYLIKGNLNKKD